jgi:tetratricopeptide (TPR) repeat protein
MFVVERFMICFMVHFKKIFICLLVICSAFFAFAQPNTEVAISKDKPKQYENRKLGSETTGDKKFTILRRITQNTYTHYNYYFNASNKLNEVVEKAKTANKDDYTELLSFYNYNLEGTSQSKDDLDSVIYKCTAGILLHDLRNDWIDNLYILLGKAYLYRKDYDSAAGCFQYINYVYAPKDDGYDIPVGSNASKTKGVFTISTNEKRSVWKKITSKPPSRNESFIWQIRNYLEQDQLGEAAGLIGILRSDPLFPKRLKTDLHEMIAYWFYKQENYDSASFHLRKSLDNAEDKAEKARWEYLSGQLYQIAKNDSLAMVMYERSIKHAIDPLMEVYARLNIVSLASGKKKNALQENLNELLRLAKRDKYIDYRDIIYYAAAQLEMKRNSYVAAQNNLLKSVQFSVDNPQQKSTSFIALADLNYDLGNYIEARNYYDSVQLETVKKLPENHRQRILARKPSLKIIADNLIFILKEDSLQKVAVMPEAERTVYVKKVLKALRKAKGLKGGGEEEGSYNTSVVDTKKTDLFGDTKGEWYFLNTSLKSKGFSEFKSRWGKRNNVDNWRRQSAVDKLAGGTGKKSPSMNMDIDDVGDTKKVPLDAGETEKTDEITEEDLSFEGLMSKLPLTTERLNESNKKIQKALFVNGETFQNNLDEYGPAANTYEKLLHRFDTFQQKEPALFNLYYCYTKLGLTYQADSVLKVLKAAFPDGDLTIKVEQGNKTPDKEKNTTATKTYETIYTLFVEGKFQEAIAMKAKADASFGKTYWTPQLLFIESVYYIKQREDSVAIIKLNELIKLVPGTPFAEKAANMIEVLKKRKEIEQYLTDLQIERAEEPVTKNVDLTAPTTQDEKVETKKNTVVKSNDAIKTIDKKIDVKPTSVTPKSAFTFVAADAHYAVLVMDKVDAVFVKESRNAFDQYNKSKIYNQKISIDINKFSADTSLLLFGPFADAGKAVEYVEKVRPQTPTAILSWVPANKYSFTIISSANLALLTTNREFETYINLIKQTLIGKF